MSSSPPGARRVVLAVVLALTLTFTANASATMYASGCVLNHNQVCMTSENHTYDDHYASVGSDAFYIASWLYYPSTGAKYHLTYGWGVASALTGTNTTVSLGGGWGNYSGTNNLWIISEFNY